MGEATEACLAELPLRAVVQSDRESTGSGVECLTAEFYPAKGFVLALGQDAHTSSPQPGLQCPNLKNEATDQLMAFPTVTALDSTLGQFSAAESSRVQPQKATDTTVNQLGASTQPATLLSLPAVGLFAAHSSGDDFPL